MVIGGDLCSEGRGFESLHHILDGYLHIIVVKLQCLLEIDENKQKRGRGWPIKKIPVPRYSFFHGNLDTKNKTFYDEIFDKCVIKCDKCVAFFPPDGVRVACHRAMSSS